jgi:hypothetical protein
VVCHNELQDRRINGDKLVFSLGDHSAFDHPLTIHKSVAEVGSNYTLVTTISIWSNERDDLLAFDEDSLVEAYLG